MVTSVCGAWVVWVEETGWCGMTRHIRAPNGQHGTDLVALRCAPREETEIIIQQNFLVRMGLDRRQSQLNDNFHQAKHWVFLQFMSEWVWYIELEAR